MCYDLGKGVTQDNKEALKWLRKSADAKAALEELKSK
jgi:TPR repeat protein